MTVAEVLQGWRQALGSPSGLRTVYQRTSVRAGGMEGRSEEWQRVTGERRSEFELGGVYGVTTVFDGRIGWQKDRSGAVRELAAHELEVERTLAYLGSFSHLFGDRLPGSVGYMGEQDGFHLIEVRPEGGRTAKVFLDADTFLPARQEELENDRVQTLSFADWRQVEGVMFPFETRQGTGEAKYDVMFELQEVRLNETFDDALFTEPPRTDAPLLSGASVSLPFELSSNHVYIEGRVGDSRPLHILIDTGAGGSVINSFTARELGLEVVGRLEARGGGEGSQDLGFVEGLTLSLGALALDDLTLFSLDLAPLEELEGRKMDLILGYEFISRVVLDIDYEASLVGLHAPEGFDYRGPGARVPLTLQNNHPHVRAQVLLGDREPVETVFMVDTGARMALHLNRLFSEQHEVKKTVPKVLELPAQVTGVGGAARSSVARVRGLRLGGLELEGVVTTLSESGAGTLETPHLAGLIGGDLLRRFRVFFDYGRQEMILEPNARLGHPFVYDASGLRLVAEGDDFDAVKVQTVLAGSPAERAGLRVGDVLEALDGSPVSDFTLDGVRERLTQAGQVRRVRLRRGDEVLEAALRLEALV